jgi:hypothetical protein
MSSSSSSTKVRSGGVFARPRSGLPQESADGGPLGVVGGRLRRRPALVWVGVAVVIASSVGFAAVLAQVGRRVPVLAVARSLPAGAVIRAEDLREVRLGVDGPADFVMPVADEDAVVGKTAVVPLVAGALLTPQEVGNRAGYPPSGKAQVSFAVDPGGLPAGLGAGQRVAVFPGAPSAAPTEQPGDGAKDNSGAGLVGTVTDVTAPDRDSAASVVTVLVDTAAAGRAARMDKPHVVVLSPAGREVP